MAAPAIASSQDLIVAIKACTAPKEVLKVFKDINKAFTTCIAIESDQLKVNITSLAGSPIDSCTLSMDSRVGDLAAQIQPALSQNEIPLTDVNFLAAEGTLVNRIQPLKDHISLTLKASLSPHDVGRLMYENGASISVELLGQCLGHHDDFWKEVAISYPNNFQSFAGMDIVAAIRAYLWCFRLPGEAAQIERIVGGFAHAYFHYNTAVKKESREFAESATARKDESDDEGWVKADNQESAESVTARQDDSDDEECAPRRFCGAEVAGWYVSQPLTGAKLVPCCVHCGGLDGEQGGDLVTCEGCNVVHFCRKCRRNASRYGHAVVGAIGYGRACVAARRAAGTLGLDNTITFRGNRHGERQTCVVPKRCLEWKPVCPFKHEDSVMILAYAIIMLTTNLHSANVKEKMKKHEFIKQNRGVNGDANFPGDFLSKVYDDIYREELKVMRNVD
jgi:hypothetical protein